MQRKSDRGQSVWRQRWLFAGVLLPSILLAGCASSAPAPEKAASSHGRLADVVNRRDSAVNGNQSAPAGDTQGEANSSIRRGIDIPTLSNADEDLPPELEALRFSPRPSFDTINVSMDPLSSTRFVDLVVSFH